MPDPALGRGLDAYLQGTSSLVGEAGIIAHSRKVCARMRMVSVPRNPAAENLTRPGKAGEGGKRESRGKHPEGEHLHRSRKCEWSLGGRDLAQSGGAVFSREGRRRRMGFPKTPERSWKSGMWRMARDKGGYPCWRQLEQPGPPAESGREEQAGGPFQA